MPNDAMETQPSKRPASKSASAFRTISEVASELDLPQHVLRFWEGKFSQIRPMKRGGGRRYYRPEDVALLRRIRALLYDDGYTIKGVQKLLKQESGRKSVGEAITGDTAAAPSLGTGVDTEELRAILAELEDIRKII